MPPAHVQETGTCISGFGRVLSLFYRGPFRFGLSRHRPNKVQWSPAAEEAFQNQKTAMSSSPVLHTPDFSQPCTLQTDASDTRLGAVLSQTIKGEEHPVTYIRRNLTPPETRYAAVKKEALAIKWPVLKLHYYLLGRSFTLVTDHAPLQWMSKVKDTNARVTRCFMALQDFHFNLKTPGQNVSRKC